MSTRGVEIKRRRVAAGMMQKDLADLLHVSRSTVGYWERDQARVTDAQYDAALEAIDSGEFVQIDPARHVDADDDERNCMPPVVSDTTSCRYCPADREAECRRLGRLHLPPLCSSVSQRDVDAAFYNRTLGVLLERYGMDLEGSR